MLLEKALFSLVNPEKRKGPLQSAEVLLYSQLLYENANSSMQTATLSGQTGIHDVQTKYKKKITGHYIHATYVLILLYVQQHVN